MCVQFKLKIAGDYIVTYSKQADSVSLICNIKQVNLSCSTCHEKR